MAGAPGSVRRERNLGRGIAATLAVVVVTVVMVEAVLPRVLERADRPEGTAFRWFSAVSAGEAHDVALLGDPALVASAGLTSFERPDEQKWFERIEVGEGSEARADASVAAGPVPPVPPGSVAVPVLVVRRDTESPGDRTTARYTAVVAPAGAATEAPGGGGGGDRPGWRVVAVVPGEEGRVPSEGGRLPARAPAQAWVAFGAIALALTALAEVLVRLASRPRAAAGAG